MILYSSEDYKKKDSITLPNSCHKFTEFHADPTNYVILACDNGNIIIY